MARMKITSILSLLLLLLVLNQSNAWSFGGGREILNKKKKHGFFSNDPCGGCGKHQVCKEVNEEHCEDSKEQVCEDKHVCKYNPHVPPPQPVCHTKKVDKCKDVPKEHCVDVHDTKCKKVPKEECHKVKEKQCYNEPQQVNNN